MTLYDRLAAEAKAQGWELPEATITGTRPLITFDGGRVEVFELSQEEIGNSVYLRRFPIRVVVNKNGGMANLFNGGSTHLDHIPDIPAAVRRLRELLESK